MLMKDFKKYLEQFDEDLEVFTKHGDSWANPCVEFVPFDVDNGDEVENGEDHYIICSSGVNIQPTKTSSTIYKIHDDEWEEIMGVQQLKKFAIYQMGEKFNYCDDEEIQEHIKIYVSDEYQDQIREIINMFPDDDKVFQSLTPELAIELLKLRYFDVEEIIIN